MKKPITIVSIASLLLFLGVNAFCQDVIVKLNGEEIPAKVVATSGTDINYKSADIADAPIFTVKKSEVFMIKYGTGTKEVFGAGSAGGFPLARIENFGGKYFQNDLDLSQANLVKVLSKSPDEEVKKLAYQSNKKYKPGQTLFVVGISALAGGLLIGLASSGHRNNPSGTSSNNGSGGKAFGFTVAGLGAVSFVTGIVLKTGASKLNKAAVARYNSLTR